MTFDQRVLAVTKLGFTERQARFLVTVMLHAGVCVPRQYATFAGTAYGHNVTMFFEKLTEGGYATASGCLHNRAALSRPSPSALSRHRTASEPLPTSRLCEAGDRSCEAPRWRYQQPRAHLARDRGRQGRVL
jgi:hypothetical protein